MHRQCSHSLGETHRAARCKCYSNAFESKLVTVNSVVNGETKFLKDAKMYINELMN